MEKGWNIQTMSNFDYIEMVNEIWPSGMVITVISEDKFRFLRKKKYLNFSYTKTLLLKLVVHKNEHLLMSFIEDTDCKYSVPWQRSRCKVNKIMHFNE